MKIIGITGIAGCGKSTLEFNLHRRLGMESHEKYSIAGDKAIIGVPLNPEKPKKIIGLDMIHAELEALVSELEGKGVGTAWYFSHLISPQRLVSLSRNHELILCLHLYRANRIIRQRGGRKMGKGRMTIESVQKEIDARKKQVQELSEKGVKVITLRGPMQARLTRLMNLGGVEGEFLRGEVVRDIKAWAEKAGESGRTA